MSSNSSTPILNAFSSQSLPPVSPSPLSATTIVEDPLTDIPPLTTSILTDPDDRVDGVKLIADSIAQQRQSSASTILFSPVTIGLWVISIGVLYQYMYKDRSDLALIFTTAAGATMALMVGVRGMTSGYLAEAENISWAFLKNDDGDEDLLIGTKFGDEVIGALVLRPERAGAGASKKKAKHGKGQGGKGVIRAWTVKLRYRHRGIGTGLLEEAVKISKETLGRDAEIGFSAHHANSKLLIPSIFTGVMKRKERDAIVMLEEIEKTGEFSKKKR